MNSSDTAQVWGDVEDLQQPQPRAENCEGLQRAADVVLQAGQVVADRDDVGHLDAEKQQQQQYVENVEELTEVGARALNVELAKLGLSDRGGEAEHRRHVGMQNKRRQGMQGEVA